MMMIPVTAANNNYRVIKIINYGDDNIPWATEMTASDNPDV